MEAAPLIDAADALARRARIRLDDAPEPEPAPREALPLGLTPREHEVLLLVAEGRTNREIGELLYMSEKTASVHVSRILAKLDVGGRVEAAAVAHRLGLRASGLGSSRAVRWPNLRGVTENDAAQETLHQIRAGADRALAWLIAAHFPVVLGIAAVHGTGGRRCSSAARSPPCRSGSPARTPARS